MARIASTKVFNLVKALNKQEKRQFKLSTYSNTSKNAKFLQLFDLIDKQKTYNERLIIERLYPNKTYKKSTFSELKNYLYTTILRSLHSFDEKELDSKLYLLLLDAKALMKRNLYDEAESILNDIIKKAGNKFNEIVHAANLHRLQVLDKKKNFSLLKNDYLEILTVQKSNIKRLKAQAELQELSYKVDFISDEASFTWNSDNKQQLLNIASKCQSILAKETLHIAPFGYKELLANIYSTLGDFVSFERYYFEIMENDAYQDQYHSQCITLRFSYVYHLLMQFKLTEFLFHLNELSRHLKPKDGHLIWKFHTLFLGFYAETGQFTQGINYFNNHFKDNLPTLSVRIGEISFFMLSICKFAIEDYEEATDILNQFIDSSGDHSNDVGVNLYKLLLAVYYFDQELHELIEPTIRSFKRRKVKIEAKENASQLLSQLLLKASDASYSKTEQLAIFKDYKERLKDHFATDSVNNINRVFNFSAWIDAHINGVPFAKEVQNKFKHLDLSTD